MKTLSKKNTSNSYPELERKLKFIPADPNNTKTLNQDQINRYNTMGYLTGINIFSNQEAIMIRGYFDLLMQQSYSKGYNSYQINGWHQHLRGLYHLVSDSRIADIMSDLLGPNIICWGTHFFCKEPGSIEKVAWHQDISYWPMSESKTITVWLAIDDVNEENAAMKVIPRSHLHGQIKFNTSNESEFNVLNQTVPNPEDYGDDPVSINLQAGQIELHSDLLLHGSEANTSNKRRCGLTMRFLPPEVIAYNGWGSKSIITKGNDPYGHWKETTIPEGEFIPDLK